MLNVRRQRKPKAAPGRPGTVETLPPHPGSVELARPPVALERPLPSRVHDEKAASAKRVAEHTAKAARTPKRVVRVSRRVGPVRLLTPAQAAKTTRTNPPVIQKRMNQQESLDFLVARPPSEAQAIAQQRAAAPESREARRARMLAECEADPKGFEAAFLAKSGDKVITLRDLMHTTGKLADLTAAAVKKAIGDLDKKTADAFADVVDQLGRLKLRVESLESQIAELKKR